MNEDQAKQIQDLVQEIADESGSEFDAAFIVALGVLRFHAIESIPKGEANSGSGS